MPESSLDKLGRLNRYQIAGLAFLTSTLAAVAVLLVLRRFLFPQVPPASGIPEPASASDVPPKVASPKAVTSGATSTAATDVSEIEQPDVPEAMGATIPHHFSENLLVPGLTKTGPEVLEEDDRAGRSPEGV